MGRLYIYLHEWLICMGFHGSVNIRNRPMDGMVVTPLPASETHVSFW